MKHVKFLSLLILFCCLHCNLSAQLENTQLVITEGIESDAVKQKMEDNISLFLSACNRAVMDGKKPKFTAEVMTKDAQAILQSLWKSSEIACFVSTVEEKCLKRPTEGYQVRNIPVSLLSAPENEQETEIVINLTESGIIDDIFIAIESNKYAEIIGKNISVTDLNRRQIIIDFVENFRTSYNRKDIQYVESVFSNDALIITGKVVKQVPNSDQALKSLGRERIVYQTSTKTEYIAKLKNTFKRNKYINIVFKEIKVIQHPVFKDIYGVTLKQDWNSSTYNDVGYLFLMIDFKDEHRPLITVRTWQPQEYNNRPLARDEIFNLGTFDEIIRDNK